MDILGQVSQHLNLSPTSTVSVSSVWLTFLQTTQSFSMFWTQPKRTAKDKHFDLSETPQNPYPKNASSRLVPPQLF